MRSVRCSVYPGSICLKAKAERQAVRGDGTVAVKRRAERIERRFCREDAAKVSSLGPVLRLTYLSASEACLLLTARRPTETGLVTA